MRSGSLQLFNTRPGPLRKLCHRQGKHLHTLLDILDRRKLVWPVADAVFAGDEDHAGGCNPEVQVRVRGC